MHFPTIFRLRTLQLEYPQFVAAAPAPVPQKVVVQPSRRREQQSMQKPQMQVERAPAQKPPVSDVLKARILKIFNFADKSTLVLRCFLME